MTEPAKPRRRPPFLKFILIGVAVAAVALFLRIDHTFEMTNDDLMKLAFLVALLVFLGSGFFARVLRPGEIIRAIASWLAIILVVLSVYTYRFELARFGGRLLGALAPGMPIVAESDAGAVVVTRGIDGHFDVRSTVGSAPITFLVDTGASFVTLSFADAMAVGIDAKSLEYNLPIRTANGPMTGASVIIDRLAVGPIERRRVSALVAPKGALDQSLLGMSFLDTLGGYTITGDRLIMMP
jgi:aspartyl protease family protein